IQYFSDNYFNIRCTYIKTYKYFTIVQSKTPPEQTSSKTTAPLKIFTFLRLSNSISLYLFLEKSTMLSKSIILMHSIHFLILYNNFPLQKENICINCIKSFTRLQKNVYYPSGSSFSSLS